MLPRRPSEATRDRSSSGSGIVLGGNVPDGDVKGIVNSPGISPRAKKMLAAHMRLDTNAAAYGAPPISRTPKQPPRRSLLAPRRCAAHLVVVVVVVAVVALNS
jgi:hypothetical protein